jgi:hypothetical protein
MLKDAEKYVGDVLEIEIYFFYFFEPRVVGKHGRKDIGGYWKNSKEIVNAYKTGYKPIYFVFKLANYISQY